RTNLFRALARVRQAPALLARGREAPERTSSVPRFADPIDLRIVPDHRMLRVHKDDLVILVHPVFADPVGIEDLEIGIPLRGSFLGDPLDRFRHRDLDKAAPLRMAPSHGFRPPPATAPDPRADHDIALLRPVAELPGPIDSGRSVDSNEGVAPAPLHHPPRRGLFHDAGSRLPP